jgi:type IV pilus assembly protein PilF
MFGVVYQELKENRLAEDNFERALRLAPNDPDINHNFGWFLCQTKREPDSIKYFLQAIRNPLYPTPWRSYSAAGQCSLRTNNVKDAEAFSTARCARPGRPRLAAADGQIRISRAICRSAPLRPRYNKLVTPTAESLRLALRIERKSASASRNELREPAAAALPRLGRVPGDAARPV